MSSAVRLFITLSRTNATSGVKLIPLRPAVPKEWGHGKAQYQAKSIFVKQKASKLEKLHDTRTGVLLGIPRSARCVQRFDDSLNSAIHITYRISLRSSSMREPRDPLLKVVFY